MKAKYVRLAVEYGSYNDKNDNSNNHISITEEYDQQFDQKINLQKDATTSINNL